MKAIIAIVLSAIMVASLLNVDASPTESTASRPKVLLVSMDGFRHDYLTKTNNTPHFDAMKASGVSMEYLNNTYVTLTFPSHTSIATGLYDESHGIVSNTMYDPEFDAWFGMSNLEERFWNGSEPIWVTAKKQGKKVGVYFWPGSTVPRNGMLPDDVRDYDISKPYEERVETVVQWLACDDYDLALLYFDEPDHSGHVMGPDNATLVPVIERMDGILGLLVKGLTDAGIVNNVNLIVTSDHGMSSVDTLQRLVDVSDTVNDTLLYGAVQQGPVTQLREQFGKAQELVDALADVDHMTVMLKEDIPEVKHYRNHRRVTNVFAIADDGWQITINRTNRLIDPKTAYFPFLGDHGFDDDNLKMRPIFVAKGPAFKSGEMVEPIKNIDIYPLICHLLNIQPAAMNGSLTRARSLLASPESSVHAMGTVSHPAGTFKCMGSGNSAGTISIEWIGMFTCLLWLLLYIF